MSTLKIKRENGKIFCPLADSWHIETPEEKVRQEYIKILVENYGYSLDQMAQEIKVNNSQRGQGKARADIVIWKSKQDKIESKAAFIVVECKAENVRIREEDYYQGYNYASWAGASFFVTTNEKETKYFNVDKDYLPKELVEVVAIPTAEEALNDKKVKDILSKTKTFTRDDFTKILRTCHNIIRNNDIKTKKQYYVKAGQLAVSKIDARNGAFGIVPPEADGAIITGNFWVYDVNPEIANIDYLILLLSSNVFVQAWQDCSNGSGNRLYLQEEKFLNYKIPMPEADVQKDLIRKYNTQLAEAKKDQDSIDNLQYQIEQYILKKLGISFKRSSFNGLIGTTYYKNLTRWDPTYLSNKIIINSNEKMIDMAAVIAHFMVDTSGKRLRINTKEDPDKKFAYIGMEHVEKNTGKVFMQQISGKDILSQTVRVPYDYIIYGKLRPYLNKYWENRSATKNVVCSSEFFVFDTKNINRIYFMEILSSTIIQEQLTPLYSGARMPRINESDFMGLKIPLPSPQKQQEIVDFFCTACLRINISVVKFFYKPWHK